MSNYVKTNDVEALYNAIKLRHGPEYALGYMLSLTASVANASGAGRDSFEWHRSKNTETVDSTV